MNLNMNVLVDDEVQLAIVTYVGDVEEDSEEAHAQVSAYPISEMDALAILAIIKEGDQAVDG